MQTDKRPPLPSGWRWESYGGIQVGVPSEWGWGDSGLRLDAWCVSPGDDHPPVVARPGGPVPAIGCPAGGTKLKNTGPVVALGHSSAPDGVEQRDDRTTVRRAGVEIIVQAPLILRGRITATIHRVTTDEYGCATTHPISEHPDRRPAPPADVTTLRDVIAVSACRYEIPDPDAAPAPDVQPRLISSVRLEGAAAAAAIQRIARSPTGGGPDHPGDCLPEVADGNEAIVLRVRSTSPGPAEIVLRYAGCDHHGFDDGMAIRRLTATAMAPFTTGPNSVAPAPSR
ncbi:hypothetical protein AB0J83_37595 [Actinoplanes sp. NPDC049596]|uniref:hypothetical protein n=1 Tax=unclassified Actinoplanes TaxID=2626549 RepID=UPI0034336071